MRRWSIVLVVVLGAFALGTAACGSSDGNGSTAATQEEESVTPAQASAEIDEVKTMLDDAVSKYRAGDAEAADTIVGDAYLEHFEKVEHPLEERDHELMEDLEHRIANEIRDEMKDGADADAVARLVDETKSDLDRAKALLAEDA